MATQVNPSRILTPEEAADVLQVSKRTMYEWLRTGQVLGTQVGPRLWRIREGDIVSPDARGWLEQGLLHDANCRVEEGAWAFKEALRLSPKYNLANFHLGLMYYHWGHYHLAVEPLKKAIDLNPEWLAPYGILGMNYNYWGAYSEAEPVLKKAIELVPNHAESYYQLGYALMQQSKIEEAIATYKKTIELEPKHVMAHSFLGSMYIREREFFKAREVYESLKVLSENMSESLLRELEWAERQFLPRR